MYATKEEIPIVSFVAAHESPARSIGKNRANLAVVAGLLPVRLPIRRMRSEDIGDPAAAAKSRRAHRQQDGTITQTLRGGRFIQRGGTAEFKRADDTRRIGLRITAEGERHRSAGDR